LDTIYIKQDELGEWQSLTPICGGSTLWCRFTPPLILHLIFLGANFNDGSVYKGLKVTTSIKPQLVDGGIRLTGHWPKFRVAKYKWYAK
jgi:hypothetical protein